MYRFYRTHHTILNRNSHNQNWNNLAIHNIHHNIQHIHRTSMFPNIVKQTNSFPDLLNRLQMFSIAQILTFTLLHIHEIVESILFVKIIAYTIINAEMAFFGTMCTCSVITLRKHFAILVKPKAIMVKRTQTMLKLQPYDQHSQQQ